MVLTHCHCAWRSQIDEDFPAARDIGTFAHRDFLFPGPDLHSSPFGFTSNVRIDGGSDRGILEMRFARNICPDGCDYSEPTAGADGTPSASARCSSSNADLVCTPVQSEFSEWGAVCDNGFDRDHNQAKAVCQSLGFETFEMQQESCEVEEAVTFDASFDAETRCVLNPSVQVPSSGIWRPGSCQVEQGNGRCKYVPSIPRSYGFFTATHGNNDFAVDNLICPHNSTGLEDCTMSEPWTERCNDAETIGIDCNVMRSQTCTFQEGNDALGCPPTPFALGASNTTCAGLGLVAASDRAQCADLATQGGEGFGGEVPEDIYGCFRYISEGSRGGQWMFSAEGSTTTACDGSGPLQVAGYECLCAKYDGAEVQDSACDECNAGCETMLIEMISTNQDLGNNFEICSRICDNKRECGGPNEDVNLCENTHYRYGADKAERCMASTKRLYGGIEPQCYWRTDAEPNRPGYFDPRSSNYHRENGRCIEDWDWCGDCHASCFGDESCSDICDQTACRRNREECEVCNTACNAAKPTVLHYWPHEDTSKTCEMMGYSTIRSCTQEDSVLDEDTCLHPSDCQALVEQQLDLIYTEGMCTCIPADMPGTEACENQGFDMERCDYQGCCKWEGNECRSNVGDEACYRPPIAEMTELDPRYCPSSAPFICLDVHTKRDYELTWEESLAAEMCSETCKNEPYCWTPGEGLSWAQNMGGDGRGQNVSECSAYKLRPGSTYKQKCENSSKVLYNGQPKCFWDTLSNVDVDCNINPYECSANRGDCLEETDYCGNCRNWCRDCITDFGVAACTPLQECLDNCDGSPDCNRNRVECEECKTNCEPPVRSRCCLILL